MISEIYFYVGSSLAIVLSLFELVKGIIWLKKEYSKKLEINIDSFYSSYGPRKRTSKETEELKGFSKKLPNITPTFGLNLRLINYSKDKNVIDLRVYTKKRDGQKLYLFTKDSILLLPATPVKIFYPEIIFNWANEIKLWEGIQWEGKTDEELERMLWDIFPECIYVEAIDAEGRKKITGISL
jgi:hypothetical protein